MATSNHAGSAMNPHTAPTIASQVELSGSTLTLSGPVNFSTAWPLYQVIEHRLHQHAAQENHFQALTLDCAGIRDADSSAISLLMEIQRLAQALDLNISIVSLNDELHSLVRLYEVDWLLG